MKEPIFIRSLTDKERDQLRSGLRSPLAFTLRRCQIFLLSEAGQTPRQIARQVGCSDQTVRNALRVFAADGIACLLPQSSRPKTTKPIFDEATSERLRQLLHNSPRTVGKPRSLWDLKTLAEVCFEQGLTPRLVSDETIRQALKRMQVNWKRARHFLTSPDPQYKRKKKRATA